MRRLALSALVCCVGFAGASCGGGDDKADDASVKTASSPTTKGGAALETTTTTSKAAIDVKTIKLSHAPSGVAIDGDVLWYTSSDDDVLVQVDLATGTEKAARSWPRPRPDSRSTT